MDHIRPATPDRPSKLENVPPGNVPPGTLFSSLVEPENSVLGLGGPAGDSLEQVASEVRGCLRCRLAESRTHAVPGHGAAASPLLLVGEAPGAKEDATGLPFQGAAGRFLDGVLADLEVARERLFITSVNKCRPPRNRVPRADEQAACRGYLDRQLVLIRPRVVLAMGTTAALALHPEATRRSRLIDLRGLPAPLSPEQVLLVSGHPAAAMRFPAQRQPFVEDLTAACRMAGLIA